MAAHTSFIKGKKRPIKTKKKKGKKRKRKRKKDWREVRGWFWSKT